MTVSYPAFERVLYELLAAVKEEARFNENRAFTHLKRIFKQSLPENYTDGLKHLTSFAREMLQEAGFLQADRPSGINFPFTISPQGEALLAQQMDVKRITLADLIAYPSFIDFVNYRVTIRLNVKYETRYANDMDDLSGYYNISLIKQEELLKTIHEADEFLVQYYKEINSRLDFFSVYDMKKEDLDGRKKLTALQVFRRCRQLLEDTSKPQPVSSQNNHLIPIQDIPSMIADQNKKLREDLLAKIKVISPKQFEELSVLILGHLLYEGQPLSEFKKHLKQQGQSGDGGIDGIVTKYDRIRGNVIHYVQSKRYTTNSVQRPEVQRFVGALDPHRAKIGVFITTSKFTEGAEEYVKSLNLYDVRLVDGFELVEMMIECGIGVKKVADVTLVEINNAFFDTEASLLA